MKKTPLPTFLLLIFILLAGCVPQPSALSSTEEPATASPVSLTTPTIQPAATGIQDPAPPVTSTVQDSNVPPLSRPYYRIEANLDYVTHSLEATEWITYTNRSGEELENLVLAVEANRWPGAFTLKEATLEEPEQAIQTSLDSNRLDLALPAPLEPSESLHLKVAYTLDLPPIPPPADTTRPQPFGYTERQTNLVDWYPYIPPYRAGQGWLIHTPGFFGEHQVYEASDYQVELDINSHGLELSLAASAPAEAAGEHYSFHLEGARNFVLSASHAYQVESRQVNGVTILGYFFPYDAAAGKQALEETASALELYSELFGPYPYPSLTLVEADFFDGMEYSGLYFLSRGFFNTYNGSPAGYLTAIAVHETAHQWWYGQVGNDQAMEPWLDEALCTYMEKIFYERRYPDFVDDWWSFRVDYYEPAGFMNGTIYSYPGFVPYRNAVYLRGAQFLDALRAQIGDDAFFSFLKAYAMQFSGKLVSSQDFFGVLETHTNQDIQPLLDEYFGPFE